MRGRDIHFIATLKVPIRGLLEIEICFLDSISRKQLEQDLERAWRQIEGQQYNWNKWSSFMKNKQYQIKFTLMASSQVQLRETMVTQNHPRIIEWLGLQGTLVPTPL